MDELKEIDTNVFISMSLLILFIVMGAALTIVLMGAWSCIKDAYNEFF